MNCYNGGGGEHCLLIKDGTGHTPAHRWDGIKLVFPTGTESYGRVRYGILPTIMGGPVVGVVVGVPK